MPRGSKPGERRGGRRRATPNKRTVLTDRILAAASADPKATSHQLLSILVKDQALPAATRIAIARKSSCAGTSRLNRSGSGKSTALAEKPTESAMQIRGDSRANGNPPMPRKAVVVRAKTDPATFATVDFLFGVAQDTRASLAERRRAASQAAQFFLPKNARGRKSRRGKFPPDECGFVVDPELARELRDSKLKLACLHLAKKRTPYAVAQKARKLQTRIEEIQQSLQCPCPSKYATKHVLLDKERLEILDRRRALGNVFPPEEDADEALRMARYGSFLHGPEVAARRRLMDLREKKRAADRGYGPPLTAAQETTLRFLTLLYHLPRASADETTIAEHPFHQFPPPFIVGNPNYPELCPQP
jgi:hypothetical protein